MVYLSRVVHPGLCAKELINHDKATRDSLSDMLKTELEDDSWFMATKCIRNGGIGLRSIALHSPGAYIASVSSIAEKGSKILGCTEDLLLQLTGHHTCSRRSDGTQRHRGWIW